MAQKLAYEKIQYRELKQNKTISDGRSYKTY